MMSDANELETCSCSEEMPSNETFKLQERVMRAVASAARLKIIWRLQKGEAAVGELAELTGLDPSTVSRHLATLTAAGIVEGRREGPWVYYCLLTPCISNVLTCATTVIKGRK